jgi:predicted nucleotide-binding protein
MAKNRSGASSATQQSTIPPQLAMKRLQKLLEQIPEIRAGGHSSAAGSTWQSNVKLVLAESYGPGSLVVKEFGAIWFTPGIYYDGQLDSEFVRAFNSGLEQARGLLESRITDLQERIEYENPAHPTSSPRPHSGSRKIFVVHGHDHGIKETVARFLTKLDLEPIILHEQADRGRTLIEKFEGHAEDVGCAVVVLTADDIASSKTKPDEKELRARQNVILELGYFTGKLGRDHTFALVDKDVALPSDIHGLVYIPLDNEDWRRRLVKELQAAGLEVDANRAL